MTPDTTPDITPDTAPIIARWRERKQPTVDLYVDGRLSGYGRTLFVLMGDTLTEHAAALGVKPDFNIAMLESPPDKGAAPHIHETLEVLMPITGRWRFEASGQSQPDGQSNGQSGAQADGQHRGHYRGQHSLELGPLDTLVIPTHLYRSFRNVSGETAKLFALVVGRDMVNTIAMHPSIVAAARAAGFEVDDVGRQRLPGFSPQPVHIEAKPLDAEELARAAVPFSSFSEEGYLHVLGPRGSGARSEQDVSFSLGFVRGSYTQGRSSRLEVVLPLGEGWRLEAADRVTPLDPFDTVLASGGTFFNPDPHALLLSLRDHSKEAV